METSRVYIIKDNTTGLTFFEGLKTSVWKSPRRKRRLRRQLVSISRRKMCLNILRHARIIYPEENVSLSFSLSIK